jgi:hypothetical protein
MSIRMFRRCRAAAPVALAVAIGSFAGAKPPDLPALSREAVAPRAGSRQIEIVVMDGQNKTEAAEPLAVMPLEVEQISVMPTESSPVANADPRLAGARRLYRIGERCRREGDFDMAVNCYNETHLLAPNSVYGRKAQERLKKIQAPHAADPVSGDAETQEPPRPMPQRRAASPEVLFVPLPPRDLTIHVDEPETYGASSSILLELSDAVRAASGIDIDLEIAARPDGCVRARGSIQAGNLGCKVLYQDGDGRLTLLVVPTKP